MTNTTRSGITLGLVLACAASAGAQEPAKKKVLVELYTSQGCNSCPSAETLVGTLPAMGYGPDKVVVMDFHVDYFNTPWKDPFSDPAYSRREMAYNTAKKRTDLYFTPMLMVDGRYPMLGSDRPKLAAGLARALAEKPGVALGVTMDGQGGSRSLAVEVRPKTREAVARDLMVGVAITEDPVSTRVPSGENAGETLVEHHVVRAFEWKKLRLDEMTSKATLSFNPSLPQGADPARSSVAVFVQDWNNGVIHQADSLRWDAAKVARAE